MTAPQAPQGARFVASHEYVIPQADLAVIGISPYAVEQLGDVVFVELPSVGTQLTKGKSFGVVESVKAVSDLYAPIDGEVVEINGALADDPALLATDAYSAGWMLKLKPSNPTQLEAADLMSPDHYTTFIGSH